MRRVVEHYRQHGTWKTALWVITKAAQLLLSIFYQKANYAVLVDAWNGVASFDEKNFPGIHCKIVEPDDLPVVAKVFGQVTSDRFRKRLEKSYGFLIYEGNELAGYSWASANPVMKEGDPPFFFNVHPKPRCAYFYNDFVRPEKRGHGIGQVLMCYRINEVRRKGLERGFGLVKTSNVPQMRVIEKYGWITSEVVTFRRYLWWIFEDVPALSAMCDVRKWKR